MSEIKQEVIDLAAKIKGDIKVNKDGSVTIADGFYEKNLPADTVTMDQLKALQQHNNTFIAATGLVIGEEAIAVMKKNAEVNQVTAEVPMVGKDSLNYMFQRSKMVPDVANETSKQKFGSLSVKFDMYGSGTRGELKKVKQELSEKATAAFGG